MMPLPPVIPDVCLHECVYPGIEQPTHEHLLDISSFLGLTFDSGDVNLVGSEPATGNSTRAAEGPSSVRQTSGA